MKNKLFIMIVALAFATVGLVVGFVFKVYEKIDFSGLIYKEDKTVESAKLPVKTTDKPVGILTVEQLFNIDTILVRKIN